MDNILCVSVNILNVILPDYDLSFPSKVSSQLKFVKEEFGAYERSDGDILLVLAPRGPSREPGNALISPACH